MDVLLVRHAVAEARDRQRWPDDALRPLTEKGAQRFSRAARGLGLLVPTVDRVFASPYVRAWATAAILERDTGWPAAVEAPELAAEHPVGKPLDLLDRADGASRVALVGHEPQLSTFASLLLADGSSRLNIRLMKGGTMQVRLDSRDHPAQLRWLLTPKVLRSLAPP